MITLVTYTYPANSPEWAAFKRTMMASGHVPVTKYERATPPAVAQAWPMLDHYITDTGAKVWPWVVYAAAPGAPHRGYILQGAAPLPRTAPAKPPAPARPQRAIPTSVQAAHWFVARQGRVSRAKAARNWGVTVTALSDALRNNYQSHQIPRHIPQGRAAKAVEWMKRTGGTRQEAAREWGISEAAIYKAAKHRAVLTR